MVTAHAPVSRPGEPTELTDAQIDQLLQGEHPIVLVDGVCHFCQGATKFIIKRDPQGIFHFASLQSEVGQKLLQKGGLSTTSMDTFVLVEQGTFYTRSTAALRIAKRLKLAWKLLYVFMIVPRVLRDGVYKYVARNRYRWFGKSDQCMLPTPDIRARFVE